MRECLGWLTNCSDDRRCPQNWLERAVSEGAGPIRCHVCERDVQVVLEVDAFEANDRAQTLSVLPVVPCAGGPALDYPPGSAAGNFGGEAMSAHDGGQDAGYDDHAYDDHGHDAGYDDQAYDDHGADADYDDPGYDDPGYDDHGYEPEPAGPAVLYCTLLNGERVKCDKDTMIIGRSRTCDVVIPSAKVSRQHASITLSGGVWFLEDLGSANGVWRSGEKISRSEIRDGDVFTISEETLTFDYH
jgi:hypothetical protein